MDAVCAEGPSLHYYGGLRGPERCYALIDFETTVLMESATVSCLAEHDTALAGARRRDLDQLARTLEITLRVSTALPSSSPVTTLIRRLVCGGCDA